MDYKAELKLTTADGLTKILTGTLSDAIQPPQYALDFTANFRMFPPGTVMQTSEDWAMVFEQAYDQGASVYCLEQNTDATRHDFTIKEDGIMQVFMPKGSYGMGHRSVNINLGKVNGPVNVAFEFMVTDVGQNLFVNGGGKWGPAIQYGPIQSGPTGGIRFMPVWPAGGSQLGKQDLCVAIQNQPDGQQWLQPPYYAYRPLEYNHWYNIHLRMVGAASNSGTVTCQYWKDSDPEMSYIAETDNLNAQQDKAGVMIDWTCFFGGTEQNKAPADAYFNYRDLHIWVEA